ncbi:gastrin/cholecystokinin type B receptor-like [Ornithodoros turicata]|uniref:gastrin/cholecystokinin type B receptor-like n=1 Tax=Ornithodoros turicata TaxID=34597 RepID=UPI003139BFB3
MESDDNDHKNYYTMNGWNATVLYNFSDFERVWYKLSGPPLVLQCLPYVPVILFGTFGNLAILCVVAANREMRKRTNFFICNMAVADLLTTVVSSWQVLVTNVYQFYVLGGVFCRLEGLFQGTFLFASVLSLMVISLDRLLAVARPFSRRLSRTSAVTVIGIIWVVAVALASPLVFTRRHYRRIWADLVETWCTEVSTAIRVYWIVLLVPLFYAPLVVIIVAYSMILFKMDKFEKMVANKEQPSKTQNRRKVVRMFFVYLINYFCCWLPFQVLLVYRYLRGGHTELPPWFPDYSFAAHVMVFANSAINPIIYGVCNQNFKSAFKDVLVRVSTRWHAAYPSSMEHLRLFSVLRSNKTAPAIPEAP